MRYNPRITMKQLLLASAVLAASAAIAADAPLRNPIEVAYIGFKAVVDDGRVISTWKRYRRDDFTGDLSGGLRRRVEIAKALLHNPKVLLMDEPSTGLDPVARRELWQFMSDLRKQEEITVLVTTHFLEEAERCDSLLLIHEGKAVTRGTPAELKARVGGDVVSFEVTDSAAMQLDIKSKFGYESTADNGVVRVEIANGHRFAAEAVEAFPGSIQSVAFHKPTIEDVYFKETGARL